MIQQRAHMIFRSTTFGSFICFVLAAFIFPSSATAQQDWTFCANENAFCAFAGAKEVRYGANGLYKYQTLTGGTACTNNVFGDPLIGVVKQCDIRDPLTSSTSFSGTTIYVSTSGVDTNAGTQSSPVRTIQRGVVLANQANAAGRASRVLIAAGVYRESVDLGGQKTDAALTIQGSGTSTVLTGADVFSGWTLQSDGSLTHYWPYQWGMKPLPSVWSGYWSQLPPEREILRRSEIVYVNGTPLRGVLSLAQLVAGTFYVSESTAQLYVRLPTGLSLAQANIEVGTRVYPLTINGRRNVTLLSFAVMRSRGAIADTAVRITNSRNVTLDNITVRWMAYQAIGSAANTTLRIRRSVMSDNGVKALGQIKDVDVVVEDSEIARNNWRGWPVGMRGWDSVHKWSGIRDGIVRRTRFVNNWGNGFWVDSDNKRITLENSLITGQGLTGVWLENNQGPITITGNRICNNIQSGVADGQSDHVTLRNNQIWGTTRWNFIFTGFYGGRTMTDWQTGQSITNRSLYWTFDGNIVAGQGSEGWLWWHTDYLAPGAWRLIRDTMILLDNNRWYHSGRTTAFKLPQGSVTYPAFRSDVQQSNSLFEVHSAWQAPPALSCTMP
jgi:hypothetical protein